MSSNNGNPFQITTPEDLSAKTMVDLFVDVFTDFQQIIDPGHVFLCGPRGVGKSMMFRYLQPDCQCLEKKCALSDLPFLGIYIPLKKTDFAITEFKRLEQQNNSATYWNEHVMVVHFCITALDCIISLGDILCALSVKDTLDFYNNEFVPLYELNGNNIQSINLEHADSAIDILQTMRSIMLNEYRSARQYMKKLSFSRDIIPYDGPLFDYLDFLFPLLRGMKKISGFPNGPVYLLIDDAQRLSDLQTRILNSWVATRTGSIVSLKISTQYNYKTYYTSIGETIDTPHDYSEIDMSTIYTISHKSKYKERIESIISKRLNAAKINVSPELFFPEDAEQENAITIIADSYRHQHDIGQGKGYYRNDDAIRYARPDFIANLAGKSKSSPSYSYSGFDQLVRLSSGIIRHFLEPAHRMYAQAVSESENGYVEYITPTIQNSIIRKQAERFLFQDLDKLKKGGQENSIPEDDIDRLSNLLQGLGGLFRQVLLTKERSERRVYSIAISDAMSKTSERILELGVQLGYFHKSTIGRKDSKSGGRTRLYVMNRFLAPIWTLDPTGFAGYLFVKNDLIEQAMEQPFSMLNRLRNSGFPDPSNVYQITFFDNMGKPDLAEIGDDNNDQLR